MQKLELSKEDLEHVQPVFLFTFSINTDGAEYYFEKVVKAPTADEAADKARNWMRNFWATSTHPDPNDADIFWNSDRSVSISLCTVKQVTTDQLVSILSLEPLEINFEGEEDD